MSEKLLRAALKMELAAFYKDLSETVYAQVGDQIDSDTPPDAAKILALKWAQRVLYEMLADDFGPAVVAWEFDNLYYQICSRHIGPEDFSARAAPYERAYGGTTT